MQVAHMHNYSDLHPTCQRFPVWNETDYFLKKKSLNKSSKAPKKPNQKKRKFQHYLITPMLDEVSLSTKHFWSLTAKQRSAKELK